MTVVPSKFAKCTVASFAVSNFAGNASSQRHLSRSCNPRSGTSGPLRSASGWRGWSQPQALSKLGGGGTAQNHRLKCTESRYPKEVSFSIPKPFGKIEVKHHGSESRRHYIKILLTTGARAGVAGGSCGFGPRRRGRRRGGYLSARAIQAGLGGRRSARMHTDLSALGRGGHAIRTIEGRNGWGLPRRQSKAFQPTPKNGVLPDGWGLPRWVSAPCRSWRRSPARRRPGSRRRPRRRFQ